MTDKEIFVFDIKKSELDTYDENDFNVLIREIRNEYRSSRLLNEAVDYYSDLIDYALSIEQPNLRFTDRNFSIAYYEMAYAQYLDGDFNSAILNMEKSVDYSKLANNEIGELISRCVLCNIMYCGEKISANDAFDKVFQYYQSITNVYHETGLALASDWVFNANDFLIYYSAEMGNIDVAVERLEIDESSGFMLAASDKESPNHKAYMKYRSQHCGAVYYAAGEYQKSIEFFSYLIDSQVIKEEGHQGFDDEYLLTENAVRNIYYCALSHYKLGDFELAKIMIETGFSVDAKYGNHFYQKKLKTFIAQPDVIQKLGSLETNIKL